MTTGRCGAALLVLVGAVACRPSVKAVEPGAMGEVSAPPSTAPESTAAPDSTLAAATSPTSPTSAGEPLTTTVPPASVASGSDLPTASVEPTLTTTGLVAGGSLVITLTETPAAGPLAAQDLTAGADGAVVGAKLFAGSAYAVTVKSQPTGEICLVTPASGTTEGLALALVATCTSQPIAPRLLATGLAYGEGVVVEAVEDATGKAQRVFVEDGATPSAGAAFAYGGSFTLTVKASPRHQQCAPSGGATQRPGVDGLLKVACAAPEALQGFAWVFEGGRATDNGLGVFGASGVSDASFFPGARSAAGAWVDAAGRFNLVAGNGFGAAAGTGALNDVWRMSADRRWAWLGGATTKNAAAAYTDPVAANVMPAGNASGSTWVDTAGTMHLFGGAGNEHWVFAAGRWSPLAAPTSSLHASFGTKSQPDPANLPGRVSLAASCRGAGDDLYLVGGTANDEGGTSAVSDVVWRFDGSNWAWLAGTKLHADEAPSFGARRVTAAGNLPPARAGAACWVDAARGDLWLFGGLAGGAYLNDLWKLHGGVWTWMNGSSATDDAGMASASPGRADAAAFPSARANAQYWRTPDGTFWLYGGNQNAATLRGDLWTLDAATGDFTSVGGDRALAYPGAAGAPRSARDTVPGVRRSGAVAAGADGRLWMFGGRNANAAKADLWSLAPQPLCAVAIAEGSTTFVGSLAAAIPGCLGAGAAATGYAFSVTAGDDGAHVSVAGDALVLDAAAARGTKASYSVQLDAEDAAHVVHRLTVEGTVVAPPVFTSPAAFVLPGDGATTAIGTVAATAQGGSSSMSYDLTSDPDAAFLLDAATGALRFRTAPAYAPGGGAANTHHATVRAIAGAAAVASRSITVTVIDPAMPFLLAGATVINGSEPQRSKVFSVKLAWTLPVTVAADAVTVTRVHLVDGTADHSVLPVSGMVLTPSGDHRSLTIKFVDDGVDALVTQCFAPTTNCSLADGLWRVGVDAAKVTAMTGGAHMASSQAIPDFPRLFGDFDGDGCTETSDSTLFSNSYFGQAADASNEAGDFDADGFINGGDFGQFGAYMHVCVK